MNSEEESASKEAFVASFKVFFGIPLDRLRKITRKKPQPLEPVT
jgi:hypothetical protein